MLAIDPTFPADWKEVAGDPSAMTSMLALGREAVRACSERQDAGELLTPSERRVVHAFEEVEAGRAGRRRAGGEWRGYNGIMRAGWLVALRAAFPTQRSMAPLAALLAIQSRLNVQPLLTLTDTEFGIELDDDPESLEAGGGDAPTRRLRGAPYKGRSHRPYPVDFPVTLEDDDPAPIIDFVRARTAGVREHAGRLAWSLFLYVGDLSHSGTITSFARYYLKGFPLALEQLCARAGVPRITSRELRRIGIDLVHEACDGDPVTMRAAGDWVDLGTGERHYFGPAVVMRGQESLGWAAKIEERRLEWDIDVVGRPRGGDLFSATDGFRCRSPLQGPDPQEPGELCHARGLCAICPHGDVDVADPAWSFAQMVALADHIATRLARGASPAWIARYGPVLTELLELWLPYFPDEILDEARLMPPIDYKELTYV
jgi:hypothetical protein